MRGQAQASPATCKTIAEHTTSHVQGVDCKYPFQIIVRGFAYVIHHHPSWVPAPWYIRVCALLFTEPRAENYSWHISQHRQEGETHCGVSNKSIYYRKWRITAQLRHCNREYSKRWGVWGIKQLDRLKIKRMERKAENGVYACVIIQYFCIFLYRKFNDVSDTIRFDIVKEKALCDSRYEL